MSDSQLYNLLEMHSDSLSAFLQEYSANQIIQEAT